MYSITERGPLADKLIPLAEGTTTVLRGGGLIDGSGRDPVADATIVIEGERIAAVGPSATLPIPEGDWVRVIDTSGQVVIPGLIDCHVHFYGENTFDAYARYFNQRPGVRTIRSALVAFATLEAGFTTVRDLGMLGAAYELRDAIDEGLILGPRILTAGWALSETGGHADWHVLPYQWVKENRPRGMFCDGPADCRQAARLNFREGADLVKIFASSGNLTSLHDWPPVPNFTCEEIAAIVDEAHKRGKKAAAHAMGDDAIRNCLRAGVDTIEHSGFLSDYNLLDQMAEQGVILVPTLSVFYWVAAEGAQWGAHPAGIERAARARDAAMEMVREARARGVKLALGTDTCTTFGIGQNARELALLAEAGLTPLEALTAGTRTAAEALGLERALGTLEAGKLADLLILDRDPLQDLSCLIGKEHVKRIARSRDPLVGY